MSDQQQQRVESRISVSMWKPLSLMLHTNTSPTRFSETVANMEGAGSDLAKGVVSGNMFINADHVRRAVCKKICEEYQKDKDVVRSVKLWFHKIEGGGGGGKIPYRGANMRLLSSHPLLLIAAVLVSSPYHVNAQYKPATAYGSASAFVEGKYMIASGGASNGQNLDQTFELNLSVNWTTAQPAFKPLAGMPMAIYRHSATLLNDNNTFFVQSQGKSYRLSISNNRWATDAVTFGWNGNGVQAVTDPSTGIVYLPNGFLNTTTNVTFMQTLNPSTNAVETIDMHPALQGVLQFRAAFSTIRQSLLIHGGAPVNTNNAIKAMYEYSLRTKSWSLLNDQGQTPPGRRSHCFVPAYNGTKIVAFGGLGDQGSVYLSDVRMMDVKTLQWELLDEGDLATVSRSSPVCAVTNDLLVIWGGAAGSSGREVENNVTLVFNLKKKVWQDSFTPLADMSSPPPTLETSNKVGLIAGVIAGVVVLAAVAGFIFYRRRKQRTLLGGKGAQGAFMPLSTSPGNSQYGQGGASPGVGSAGLAGQGAGGEAYAMGYVSPQQQHQAYHNEQSSPFQQQSPYQQPSYEQSPNPQPHTPYTPYTQQSSYVQPPGSQSPYSQLLGSQSPYSQLLGSQSPYSQPPSSHSPYQHQSPAPTVGSTQAQSPGVETTITTSTLPGGYGAGYVDGSGYGMQGEVLPEMGSPATQQKPEAPRGNPQAIVANAFGSESVQGTVARHPQAYIPQP
ncbi:hypothetical protein BGZ94_003820 [Podila epigama]|nr:hypothetical protein BGZ94_003820 [Podila epigama]